MGSIYCKRRAVGIVYSPHVGIDRMYFFMYGVHGNKGSGSSMPSGFDFIPMLKLIELMPAARQLLYQHILLDRARDRYVFYALLWGEARASMCIKAHLSLPLTIVYMLAFIVCLLTFIRGQRETRERDHFHMYIYIYIYICYIYTHTHLSPPEKHTF